MKININHKKNKKNIKLKMIKIYKKRVSNIFM